MYGFPSRYGLDGQFCTWYDNYLSGFGSNTFVRDNRGRRIRKNNILFIYDSQDRLIKQSNGVEFFYDHTGVAGISYNGTLYTYEKDIFGNVISILDRDGRRVVQYMYDAWGNHKIVDGYGNTITSSTHIGIINPIRYRSYYYDTETGLYYLHARYYDPVIGRFISPDDVDYIDPETINGLNLYAYCSNNPVMNVDPTGHSFFLVLLGALIGSAIGFTTSVVTQAITNNGQINWWQVILDTVIGGISGALGLSSISKTISMVAGGLLGAGGSIASTIIEAKGDFSSINWFEAGINAVFMGAIGVAFGARSGYGTSNTKAMNAAINKGQTRAAKAFLNAGKSFAKNLNDRLAKQNMYQLMAKAIFDYKLRSAFTVFRLVAKSTIIGNIVG